MSVKRLSDKTGPSVAKKTKTPRASPHAWTKPWASVDMTAQNPWNLPDWRDHAQYPTVEGTSDSAWRWEFIRRHRAYRKLWLHYQSNKEKWDALRSDRSSRVKTVAGRLQLSELYSPACRSSQVPWPLSMLSSLYEITPAFRSDMSDFCERAARKGQYLVAISPNASLNDQLESIKADILAMNKEWQDWDIDKESPSKPKWTRRNFPLYLRVLDARDQTHPHHAGADKISSVLSKEKHNKRMNKDGVRDLCASARATLDKFLLTMPA